MPTHLTVCPEPHTPGEIRRAALANLQVELHVLGLPALVALSASDHPVLYTVKDGRRVAIVVVQFGGSWWFVWGRHNQVSTDDPAEAARFLAGRARLAPVADYFRRTRPQPRGSTAPVPAVPAAPITPAPVTAVA